MLFGRSFRAFSRTVKAFSQTGAERLNVSVFQDRSALFRRPQCGRPVARVHTSSLSQSVSSAAKYTVTEEPDTLYQRVLVLVKGHDRAVLDSYEQFATLAAKELGLSLGKVSEPPKDIERFTLLKSVHIFKKHRVQYEMRTHYRLIELERLTGSTAQVYLEYIQRNLPEGVAMEVTKTALEKIPEHIQKPMWGGEDQEQPSQ
ncbi:small ribosomal subunit protein uS10m [Chanos chanos]|uniref:Small ribosomal subunit protein uS10m n=1 Tax=Chanos chanos TaxID=29144 RepID=A0A6J2VZ51_CHACN|nr:28S ribosomal protein S10, mitochondrial [Chanos chanos]